MKKNLAKILVLVLLITMLVPAAVSAAGTRYKVDLKLEGPNASGENKSVPASTNDYVDGSGSLSQLITQLGDLEAAAKTEFAGTGLGDLFNELYTTASAGTDDAWAAELNRDDLSFQPAGAKGVLADRTKTIIDLAAVASTITAKLTVEDKTYTVTMTLTRQGGSSSSSDSTGTGGGTTSGEESVVVDASDAAESKPLVVEETVEVADSAEEAKEIVLEDIPEDVKELSVEVALEAPAAAAGAEPAEVSENTTVLAVKDKDGNVTIIPMAVIEIDEDGNITAKGSLNEELTELLKDGGSLIAYDNEQEEFNDVKAAVEEGTVTQEEADAVAYWQARGVTEGVGGGNLGGIDEEVSRARFATLLYRAFGEPETEGEADYADLTGSFAYAKDAATWAAEAGLMNGIGNDEEGNPQFGTGPIEAWQMALIMYRALGNNDSSDDYSDSWNWAVANGLVSGDKDATPDMPALLLMMKNLATYMDGAKMEGDSELETAALED